MTSVVYRLRYTASKGISAWGDLQIEAADEIERLTAEVAGLRKLMHSVAAELDDDAPNGPGCRHEKPGAWDKSNKSNIADKPCKWCALWTEFKLAARKGSHADQA